MIKIGILGYGNIGRGVEAAVTNANDMELAGVFTRRDPESVETETGAKVYKVDDLYNMKDEIDVLMLCGGSANDLPVRILFLAVTSREHGACLTFKPKSLGVRC